MGASNEKSLCHCKITEDKIGHIFLVVTYFFTQNKGIETFICIFAILILNVN